MQRFARLIAFAGSQPDFVAGLSKLLDISLASHGQRVYVGEPGRKPALSDEERAERLKQLADRLRRPDGLDHDALAQVEQLNEP